LSSSGTIELKLVFAMLDTCAPGHQKKKRLHNWKVSYNGHEFRNLKLGEHGSNRPEVFMGFVRQMARQLLIEDCAKRELPTVYS
jgi:hypothetical protein